MSVGYIGLGNMGRVLAGQLLKRQALLVHDRDPRAVQLLADQGAMPCPSPSALAARCRTIILCLPTSAEVRDVVLGEDGIAAAAARGTIIVDQTTGDPAAIRALSPELERRGIEIVDAPVSGGIEAARAGTIAIIVGGTAAQFQRVEPTLKGISPNVFHAGALGSGYVVKLANNLLFAATRLLTLEVLALAAKNGVDPAKTAEILRAGSARSLFLERVVPNILAGQLASGFTFRLLHKDVSLATKLAHESGIPMLFGNLVREFYQLCINEMGRDAQVNSAALVIDRMAGTHVVPERYTLE
jgi:3-hydroxyisobutyrate dehydrogenase